jgi:hypothetical protein
VGSWAWDQDKIQSKIETSTNPNDCLAWNGNANQHANIHGGYCNGKPQMNSANRFIYMALHGEDISDYAVHMSCGNTYCANERHMMLMPNQRLGLTNKKIREYVKA